MQTELLLLLFLCFCLDERQVLCDDQLVYKLTNIECQGNPDRVKNISCSLKAINWNKAIANMDCYLTVPLRNPVVRFSCKEPNYGPAVIPHLCQIRLQLFQRDYANQWKPFLVDVSVNVNDVISRRSFLPYGVIMWKCLQRFTNVNHSFPISVWVVVFATFSILYSRFQGHLFARNGYLDTSLVPPFPIGIYQLSSVIVDKNSTISEHIGTVKFYMQSMLTVKSKKRPKS